MITKHKNCEELDNPLGDSEVPKSADRLFGHLPQYHQTKAQIEQLRNMADNGNEKAKAALRAVERSEKETAKQARALFDE